MQRGCISLGRSRTSTGIIIPRITTLPTTTHSMDAMEGRTGTRDARNLDAERPTPTSPEETETATRARGTRWHRRVRVRQGR